MPLPEIGQQAPDFTLTEYNGSATHHLSELTQRSPGLIAFFKRSCATSLLTLPFIERLHQHYPALQILGISQDDADDTSEFVQRTGLTFPVVRDGDWKVSTVYDLFTVPSVFLIDTGGAVRRINMGWSTEQYTALSDEIARALNKTAVPLLAETDKVPVFKPG